MSRMVFGSTKNVKYGSLTNISEVSAGGGFRLPIFGLRLSTLSTAHNKDKNKVKFARWVPHIILYLLLDLYVRRPRMSPFRKPFPLRFYFSFPNDIDGFLHIKEKATINRNSLSFCRFLAGFKKLSLFRNL